MKIGAEHYAAISHRLFSELCASRLWRIKSENAIVGCMVVKTCRVTCRDSLGVAHTVDVTAQTLYEAVAQALRLFRENDWADDAQRVPALVTVRVKQPEMEHTVRTRDFESWLDSAPRSPAEMALKVRLRAILK